MGAHAPRQSDLDVETCLDAQRLQGPRDLPGFSGSSSSSFARQFGGTSTYANQFHREKPSSSFSDRSRHYPPDYYDAPDYYEPRYYAQDTGFSRGGKSEYWREPLSLSLDFGLTGKGSYSSYDYPTGGRWNGGKNGKSSKESYATLPERVPGRHASLRKFRVPNFYRRMFHADVHGPQPPLPTTSQQVDQVESFPKPYFGLDLHRVEGFPCLKGQGPDTDVPPITDQLHPGHLSSGSLINAEEEFLEISGTDLPGVSLILRNLPNRFPPILLMNLLFTNSRVTKDTLMKKAFQGPSLVAWWRMFSYPDAMRDLAENPGDAASFVARASCPASKRKFYKRIHETHEEFRGIFSWEKLLQRSAPSFEKNNGNSIPSPPSREPVPPGSIYHRGPFPTAGNRGPLGSDNEETHLDDLNLQQSPNNSAQLRGPWTVLGGSGVHRVCGEILDPQVAQVIDFFHLPRNGKGINLGYAFVHFRDKQVAGRFRELMDGTCFPGLSRKRLSVEETSARLIPIWRGRGFQESNESNRSMFWFDDEPFATYVHRVPRLIKRPKPKNHSSNNSSEITFEDAREHSSSDDEEKRHS